MRFDFAVYEQRVSTEHRLWNMLLPMHGLTCQYGATRSSAICDFHTTPIFIAMQILTRGYATTSFHASLPPAVPNSRLLPVLQVSYPPTHTLCHARYSCLYQRGSACWILGTYYDDDVLERYKRLWKSFFNKWRQGRGGRGAGPQGGSRSPHSQAHSQTRTEMGVSQLGQTRTLIAERVLEFLCTYA
eukprot:1283091-Rhodomonas_salina.1